MNVAIEMNTHAVFKSLVSHGFTEQQAEGITEAVLAGAPNIKEFVTREQFNVTEREILNHKTAIGDISNNIIELKQEIREFKEEVRREFAELRAEFKHDINELRAEFKHDLNELRAEFKHDLKDLKIDMLKWMIPFFMTNILGIIGLAISLFFK